MFCNCVFLIFSNKKNKILHDLDKFIYKIKQKSGVGFWLTIPKL